jgi:arylsulfatase A-like enzyme
MRTTTPTEPRSSSTGPPQSRAIQRRLNALDVLVLSVWCGLAAGLLEVAARVLCRSIDSTNRFHGISRHFVWLVPLTYLLVFSGSGVLLSLATRWRPRWGGWLAPRLVCGFAVLPMFMVAFPQIYPQAWLIVSLGMASQLVLVLERHAHGLRRSLLKTLPALLGLVLVLAAFILGRDRLKQWRETGRPLPSATSPNVLLIVLDTVRADHLSLYHYERATSPVLERLAKRGILFEEARATAPWTLPSHASMFTGRWAHELGVKWLTPLRGNDPTLAEYLGSHGYATTGFVANKLFCSYETGLDRGFTHYEDYVLRRLSPFRTARLFDLTLKTVAEATFTLSQRLPLGPFRLFVESSLEWAMGGEKKFAASINREFVDWLSARPEPDRPFFAFLNYFDAHSPYLLPPGAEYRFGLKPRTRADFELFEHWRDVDRLRLPQHYQTLLRDCYDNCIAYLDEQLGLLFDELKQRGVLERTLVIVTSDHGEGLGEHNLFDHGVSLYRHEVRVPLLIVLPTGSDSHAVVREPVSLRDLPATVVDLVGMKSGSPFPGRSLARLWRGSSSREAVRSDDGVISELEDQNPGNPNHFRSLTSRSPLVSLAVGDFVYIRNQGDGSEELYNEREDPREFINRAQVEAMQPLVKRLRAQLDQMRASFAKAAK